MPKTKSYEPHCPAVDCNGGDRDRLYKTSAESVEMPPDILERQGELDVIYRCNYCGFVWFQSSGSAAGFDPTPAGFYDHFMAPGVFTPLLRSHQIREENTSAYWRRRQEKSRSQRR